LEHLVGIEEASLAHQKRLIHLHQAFASLDCKAMASFMGLAFKVEAFDFEVLDIEVENILMVVAFLQQIKDHIEEQLVVHRQVVQR